MKRLLILGGAEFQIPLIKSARKMGVYTCVVDINTNANGFEFADEHVVCSIKDHEAIYEIAKKFQPDGITPGMVDVAVNTTAIVCDRLGLPGLKPEVARNASNKLLMIEAFEKNDVPHPFFKYIKSVDEIDNIDIPYPLISKPIDMAGSRGINYISNKEELVSAIENSIKCSDIGEILIEEFMVGPEVSVEMVVKGNDPYVIQITDKLTSGKPHFMELGHSQPSRFTEVTRCEIEKVACSAVKALKLSNCIVHAEIIITNEGPKMVELGARMGGDAIHQYLLEYSTGINMPEIAIKIALGEDFEIPVDKLGKSSAIRFIESKQGEIRSISYDKDIAKEAKIVQIYCKQGDCYSEAKDNSGRFGYVIAQADTPYDAVKICERVIDSVKIEI